MNQRVQAETNTNERIKYILSETLLGDKNLVDSPFLPTF